MISGSKQIFLIEQRSILVFHIEFVNFYEVDLY